MKSHDQLRSSRTETEIFVTLIRAVFDFLFVALSSFILSFLPSQPQPSLFPSFFYLPSFFLSSNSSFLSSLWSSPSSPPHLSSSFSSCPNFLSIPFTLSVPCLLNFSYPPVLDLSCNRPPPLFLFPLLPRRVSSLSSSIHPSFRAPEDEQLCSALHPARLRCVC